MDRPDVEKVIKGLECCVKYPNEYGDCLGGDCPYGPRIECRKELHRDALTVLKAQEPVKPRVGHDGWFRCGGCNNSLASGERVKNFYGYPWPKYCEECGRAVKWE